VVRISISIVDDKFNETLLRETAQATPYDVKYKSLVKKG